MFTKQFMPTLSTHLPSRLYWCTQYDCLDLIASKKLLGIFFLRLRVYSRKIACFENMKSGNDLIPCQYSYYTPLYSENQFCPCSRLMNIKLLRLETVEIYESNTTLILIFTCLMSTYIFSQFRASSLTTEYAPVYSKKKKNKINVIDNF